MDEKFSDHVHKAIEFFTQVNYASVLLSAKKIYEELTGNLDEDNEFFEQRIILFYDWFLFHYRDVELKDCTGAEYYFSNYVKRNEDEKFELKIDYSVYELIKDNYRGKAVLRELIFGKKVVINQGLKELSIVKGDLFLGRIVKWEGTHFLLEGKCVLPPGLKKSIQVDLKEILKLNKNYSLEDFTATCLRLEKLRYRWPNYKHVDMKSFFQLKNTNMLRSNYV